MYIRAQNSDHIFITHVHIFQIAHQNIYSRLHFTCIATVAYLLISLSITRSKSLFAMFLVIRTVRLICMQFKLKSKMGNGSLA